MERIVVRQHPLGMLVGGMFALAGLGMGVASVGSFFQEGIKINGVVSRNPADLVMVLGFVSIFVAIGAGFLAFSWNSRTEMSDEGIAVFDWLSRVALCVPWSQVDAVGVTESKKKAWQIVAGDAKAKVPIHTWPPERFYVGLARWAPLESFGNPATPEARPDSESVHTFRASQLWYPMFFAVVWNGFIAFMVVGMANGLAGSQQIAAPLVAFAVMAGFAGLGVYLAFSTWGVYLRSRLVLKPTGLVLTPVSGPEVALEWDDVRCVAEYTVETGVEGQRHLVLAGPLGGVCLSSDLSNYERTRDLILAALPATARVALLDR